MDEIRGWAIDLRTVYGSLWPERAKWLMREWLWEAPGGEVALLFYGLGEIGVGRDVGRIALLRRRSGAYRGGPPPEIVLRPEDALFWFEGLGDPVRYDAERQLLFLTEWDRATLGARTLGTIPRVIDLATGTLLPA